MVTVLQQRRRQLLLLSSLPRVLQPAVTSAWAPGPRILTRAVKNKYKNTTASPAYSSENYCTTEGTATKPRDKINKFTCFAIQWESAFWACLFIKFPLGNSFCMLPTAKDPLRLAHIFRAISSSCLELLPGLLNCVPSGTWAILQKGFEVFTQQRAVGDQKR